MQENQVPKHIRYHYYQKIYNIFVYFVEKIKVNENMNKEYMSVSNYKNILKEENISKINVYNN
jgi:hypothetical protein